MMDHTQKWTKVPPREDESPDEIRQQRDLYREVLDSMLLKEISHLTAEDFQFHEDSEVEIHEIIAELEAGPKS